MNIHVFNLALFQNGPNSSKENAALILLGPTSLLCISLELNTPDSKLGWADSGNCYKSFHPPQANQDLESKLIVILKHFICASGGFPAQNGVLGNSLEHATQMCIQCPIQLHQLLSFYNCVTTCNLEIDFKNAKHD